MSDRFIILLAASESSLGKQRQFGEASLRGGGCGDGVGNGAGEEEQLQQNATKPRGENVENEPHATKRDFVA